MTLVPDWTASAEFPPSAASVQHVRRFVRREMEQAGLPEPPMENAVLLASELATNAAVHGRTPMTVRLRTNQRCVRVEVADGSTEVPVLRTASLIALGGRGLQILDHLADTWGTDGTTGGKVVWFELSVAR